jgi:hypothetical protein
MGEENMEKKRDYEAYKAAEAKMEKMERELHQLIEYPPFSEIDDGSGDEDYDGLNPKWGFPDLTERGLQLQEAVKDAIKGMNEETAGVDYYDVDPSVMAKCFTKVFDEFKDDIEEARLYAKRHPGNNIPALKAYKMK